MVREERATTGAIGLGLEGHWVDLEPVSEANEVEYRALQQRRAGNPAMGAFRGAQPGGFGPPHLIRDKRSRQTVGVLENNGAAAGVAVLTLYFDVEHGRPGGGMEAVAMYISGLFDRGARLVVIEVLAFNRPMLTILRKLKIEPQARLRDHVYVAGGFHDLLLFGFDRDEWVGRIMAPYRRILPHGGRAPAAIGSKARRN